MKIRAEFEKLELEVGLSSERPIVYQGPEQGPEQKYALADLIPSSVKVRYQKRTEAFELDMTTDQMASVLPPARRHCHTIVAQLPDEALKEAEKELVGIRQHYLEIAETRKALPAPKAPPVVTAKIAGHIRS